MVRGRISFGECRECGEPPRTQWQPLLPTIQAVLKLCETNGWRLQLERAPEDQIKRATLADHGLSWLCDYNRTEKSMDEREKKVVNIIE